MVLLLGPRCQESRGLGQILPPRPASSLRPRFPSVKQWCPVTPLVIGYWTVALVNSDPLEQHVQCDLGVGGPEFKSHLWLCDSCVSFGLSVGPSRGGKRWSVRPLLLEHSRIVSLLSAPMPCALPTIIASCGFLVPSVCCLCPMQGSWGGDSSCQHMGGGSAATHKVAPLFYFSSLLTVSLKEEKKAPPPVPKKPAKSKPAVSRDKASDAGDKQRQEARKRLLAAKRAASVRQNSATESADSIEIYVPEAQTRL